MNIYKEKLLVILIIFICFIGSAYSLERVLFSKLHIYSNINLIQPNLSYGKYPWSIRSVDTQVVSKHWENVSRDSIKQQVGLIKSLGANFVAIGTPYNRPDDMRLWVEEIHNAGMNVWFRSHWNEWEGDEGYAGTITPEEYLDKTADFIVSNKDLFKEGDSFTICVEAEQVGIGLGKRFLSWDDYKEFLVNQIYIANKSFDEIGLKGKIYTNWISVNGWVVQNVYDKNLVNKLGLITIDHYVGQTNTIGQLDNSTTMVDDTIKDLDSINKKFNTPILIGEWGYQIFQPVSDVRQADVINKMFMKFKDLNYLVGVNYWVNVGNSSALFGDQYGSNFKPRMGADVVRTYYNPLGIVESK